MERVVEHGGRRRATWKRTGEGGDRIRIGSRMGRLRSSLCTTGRYLSLAALGSPGGSASRSLTPLLDSVLANRFRMRDGPVPRQQRRVVGAAREQLVEDVFHVEPDVKVVAKGRSAVGHNLLRDSYAFCNRHAVRKVAEWLGSPIVAPAEKTRRSS